MSFDINSELFALKTFEKYDDEMKYIIDSTSSLYLKIVNLNSYEELRKMFELLNLDTNSICAKEMVNCGAWSCDDCIRSDNSIYCQECWSQMKDKHINHNIRFKKVGIDGTCDCGDHNYIDSKYFCPKHKGIFTSDMMIKEYIKKSLGEKLPLNLISINQIMFDNMANYFIQEIYYKNKSTEFKNIVEDFINCFGKLCEMSTACNFIIGDLLLKKYYFQVNHNCLDFDDNGGRIIKGSLTSHKCTCHFMRYLLEFWPGKKENLVYKLISNYKLKKIIGLYYFFFFKEFIKNRIEDFEDLDFQIIFKDVLEIACNINGLIDNIYEGMIDIFNIFLNKDEKIKTDKQENKLSNILKNSNIHQKYFLLKNIILRLRADTLYILSNITLNYLSNNTNIIFKLIDMISMLHNINPIKAIFPRPQNNQGFKFENDLLNIELDMLDIFGLYISIFNFDNNDLIQKIFLHFSQIIQEKIKNELEENEYSFHITLYRAFSIFLNRYCFHISNKNNSDLYKSLNNIEKLFPDFQKCSRVIIKSIYKVFGFITACKEGLFSYYGPDMKRYEFIYFNIENFIYLDFCLLKYLLSMKENSKYFEINEIIRLTEVENSNKCIQDILKNNKIDNPDLLLDEGNKIYLNIFIDILNLILNLLRNNFYHIWVLGFSYSELKSNKIKDKLIEDILKKDNNNFIEMTKQLIINKLLINENSAHFTDITNGIFHFLRDYFGEIKIKEIIISLTNKTLTKDWKANFSLKDEFLKYIDLNYLFSPILKSKVEKYISEFKNKKVSIYNIHFYPVNKFDSKLNNVIYNHFYFNKKNYDFLLEITFFILSQRNNFDLLSDYFIPCLLNYLSIFFEYYSNFSFSKENSKLNKIMDVLENNYLKDEEKKLFCNYLVQKLKEQSVLNNLNNKKEMNSTNEKSATKSIKSAMKEKMKNKFKDKNENLFNKLGLKKTISVKVNSEACIICHKSIDKNDITKPFGLIGNILDDNYISNSFFKTIEKEYKIYYDKDISLPLFNKIYTQSSKRKSKRIISCNHYIHFDCFLKQFMNSNINRPLINFSCPLCNRISNVYIPMIINYTDNKIKINLKGFNLKYIFNYGEKYIKEKEQIKNILKEDKGKRDKDNIKLKYKDVTIFKKKYSSFVDSFKYFMKQFCRERKYLFNLNLYDTDERSPYSILIKNFYDFFYYLYNIEEKKLSINLEKNLILIIRFFMKLDLIKKEKYFSRFYHLIKELKSLKPDILIHPLIQLNKIKTCSSELLLLLSILFDYNHIEGYEKYLLYLLLPIYSFGFFLKNIYFKNHFVFYKKEFLEHLNSEEMYKFFKEDISLNLILTKLIKELVYNKSIMIANVDENKLSMKYEDNLDYLNLQSLKGKNILEILDELSILIEADANNKKMQPLYNNLKSDFNYKEIFQKILNIHIQEAINDKLEIILHPSLFGSCLPNIFKFIDLPELAIDFEFKYYDIECEICKKKGKDSLVCLICGKKVCNSTLCFTLFEHRVTPGYIFHAIICGGGRTVYMQTFDYSILFVSDNNIISKKFEPLYVNEFGEGCTTGIIGKEFKLNKERVIKTLKLFTENSFSN